MPTREIDRIDENENENEIHRVFLIELFSSISAAFNADDEKCDSRIRFS